MPPRKSLNAPWPCAACGAPIYPNQGRGRRRKFCSACTPPGSSGLAWRAANPERVAAYNEGRRLPPSSPRPCPECGEMFQGRATRLLCGQRRCRDARYKRLHPAEYAAKRARKERRRERKGMAVERPASAPTPLPVAPAPPRDALGRSLDARRAKLVQRAEMLAVSDAPAAGVEIAFEALVDEMESISALYRALVIEARLEALKKRWL